MRLEGKVAFVSGGASGIGTAIARLFVKEGARVVIGDVQIDVGQQLASEIDGGTSHRCMFVKLDVTSETDWEKAFDTTVNRFGALDILVNDAAVGVPQRDTGEAISIEDLPEAEWDRVMAVNAKGVFLGTKHAIPRMRTAGGGSIVNISSIAGSTGSASTVYGASKAAVRVFTRSTALETAPLNIRCNSVSPGTVTTPQTQQRLENPALMQSSISKHPLGRLGRPDDIAHGVLFLASDESSFITGSELVIDGGRTSH